MPASQNVIIVIGCDPGIGLETASLFAAKVFDNVALLARSSVKLAEYKTKVLEAALLKNREPIVKCWEVDISNIKALRETLQEVETMGQISCVIFNAARVGPSPFFDFEEKALIEDFMTTNVALYTAAKWSIPRMQESGVVNPCFLVTNSLLYKEPVPEMFSLSLVKTSQRSLVQSLQSVYYNVHIALLNVAGRVSPEDKERSPVLIARAFLQIYEESDRSSWTKEAVI